MEQNITNAIKRLCEENNISIGTLEKKLGFSQGLISRWDKNSPSIDKVISVCDYFHVSTDYILGRAQIKQSTTLEQLFIDKLIAETNNYNLNWKEYSSNSTHFKYLKEIIQPLSKIFNHISFLNNTEPIYELEYQNSRIYLFSSEFNKELFNYEFGNELFNYEFNDGFLSFLIMQIDKNQNNIEDNFILILKNIDFSKLNKLKKEVDFYVKNHEAITKSHMIMHCFINDNYTNNSSFSLDTTKFLHEQLLTIWTLLAQKDIYSQEDLASAKKSVNKIMNEW